MAPRASFERVPDSTTTHETTSLIRQPLVMIDLTDLPDDPNKQHLWQRDRGIILDGALEKYKAFAKARFLAKVEVGRIIDAICDRLPPETVEIILVSLVRAKTKTWGNVMWNDRRHLQMAARAIIGYYTHVETLRRAAFYQSACEVTTGEQLLDTTVCALLNNTILAIGSQRLQNAIVAKQVPGAYNLSPAAYDALVHHISLTAFEKVANSQQYGQHVILNALPSLKAWFPSLRSVAVAIHLYSWPGVPKMSFTGFTRLVDQIRKAGLNETFIEAQQVRRVFERLTVGGHLERAPEVPTLDYRGQELEDCYEVLMRKTRVRIRI